MVNLLLKSGADKEVKDTRGKMPVELATSRGYYNIVRLLSGGVLTSESQLLRLPADVGSNTVPPKELICVN